MTIEKITAFAKEWGYDDAEYVGQWRGYDTYEPFFHDDEIHHVGPPLCILVRDEKIRMTTPEESFERLDELFPYDWENEDEEDDTDTIEEV